MANRKNSKPRMFAITMTEEQLRLLNKVCEFYARVMCGQFSTLADDILFEQDITQKSWSARREAAYGVLYAARGILFPDLGAFRGSHYGVGYKNVSDAMFDFNEVIRHKLWEMLPPEEKSFCSVDSYEPHGWSSYPLPIVKEVHPDADAT